MLLTLGGMSAVVAAIIWGFAQMDKAQMNVVSTSVANILLMLIIVMFILAGMRKKVNVYDAFIEGAKDGFTTAVRIIPYLVAILVGIGVFSFTKMRSSLRSLCCAVNACSAPTIYAISTVNVTTASSSTTTASTSYSVLTTQKMLFTICLKKRRDFPLATNQLCKDA